MSQITQIKCDNLQCDQVKGESNGWWQLVMESDDDKMYTVFPFGMEVETQARTKFDFCSEECLMRAESRIRQGLDPR